ncbi:hypothetical protein TcWFU_006581 [Taenia crassiceps]|uniref:Uncharacterized protein n=1 Tax=Taenia crassiceps TaxID=6207 RepID=A0ABR4QSF7_9CEST
MAGQGYNFIARTSPVRLLARKGLLLKYKYFSNFSKLRSVTTPHSKRDLNGIAAAGHFASMLLVLASALLLR